MGSDPHHEEHSNRGNRHFHIDHRRWLIVRGLMSWRGVRAWRRYRWLLMSGMIMRWDMRIGRWLLMSGMIMSRSRGRIRRRMKHELDYKRIAKHLKLIARNTILCNDLRMSVSGYDPMGPVRWHDVDEPESEPYVYDTLKLYRHDDSDRFEREYHDFDSDCGGEFHMRSRKRMSREYNEFGGIESVFPLFRNKDLR